jgi:hypothetical protein
VSKADTSFAAVVATHTVAVEEPWADTVAAAALRTPAAVSRAKEDSYTA